MTSLSSPIPCYFFPYTFPQFSISHPGDRISHSLDSRLPLHLPEMLPVLLHVAKVYKKVWFEVSEGSHVHRLHPHWVSYLVPRSWQGLFEPWPLRTDFPWYYNLNVKCRPHFQRCEHLFPSWGLTLSGIYLEEEGHWFGGGGGGVPWGFFAGPHLLSILYFFIVDAG